MIEFEKLEEFLTLHGIAWQLLSPERHFALSRGWDAVYAGCFRPERRARMRRGVRAQDEYAGTAAPAFLIVPFLGDTAGPHSVGRRMPRNAAYECRGGGALPDLSAFASEDLFVVPPDLAWTMVHAHEDHALGGPYFLRREWLVPPTRRRPW